MEGLNTIGEVLEFAIAREVDASELYMELAGEVRNPLTRVLFENLAEEELEHKGKLELELMKEGIVAKTEGMIARIEPGDYFMDGEIQGDMELKDALLLCVEKERRSFRFYARMAGIMTDETMIETLISLAEEEARHMVRFETEYDRLVPHKK